MNRIAAAAAKFLMGKDPNPQAVDVIVDAPPKRKRGAKPKATELTPEQRQDQAHAVATAAWEALNKRGTKGTIRSPAMGLGALLRAEREARTRPYSAATQAIIRAGRQKVVKERLKKAWQGQRHPYRYEDTSRYVAHDGRQQRGEA